MCRIVVRVRLHSVHERIITRVLDKDGVRHAARSWFLERMELIYMFGEETSCRS